MTDKYDGGGAELDIFFDYQLPPELIAKHPMTPREQGRLLFYHDGSYDHRLVGDLPDILPDDCLVIFNNSRVIPAYLVGCVNGNADKTVTINLIKPDSNGDAVASASAPPVSADSVSSSSVSVSPAPAPAPATRWRWQAMVKGAKKIAVGDSLYFGKDFTAQVIEKNFKNFQGMVLLEFASQESFWQNLESYGKMPLPPYLKREPVFTDKQDYQTIFAEKNGSAASPTASLHFTAELKKRLLARGIAFLPLTLHVGLGTFLPIKGKILDHTMHQEWGEINADTADQYNHARAVGKKILALGTTSLRLLESAVDKDGELRPFSGNTDIFIKPPHRITSADYLLTNFHLPHSTLLLLVNSFIGTPATKKLYETAIEQCYRFYSYGDACLLKQK